MKIKLQFKGREKEFITGLLLLLTLFLLRVWGIIPSGLSPLSIIIGPLIALFALYLIFVK